MAALETIRVKFGVIISVLIALALLSFIIDPTTLDSALNSMSSKYDVGKIGGKSISYNEFQDEVQRYSTISEMISGSTAKDEKQQEQVRNSAWQGLVDKYLFVRNAQAAGLNVGKDEMIALTVGEMTSPVLTQNYAFFNEAGEFDPAILSEFVSNLDADPSGNSALYWQYLQNTINTQQYYAKYGSLFTAADVENPLMLRRAIEENNTTSDVDFILLPYGFAEDSTITVSGNEIKEYYKAHREFFKQQASRDMEYVVFEVKPSAEDISATNDAMSEVYDEFATTGNIKSFLSKNSERAYSEYWYKNGELNSVSPAVAEFVEAAKPGEVSTIIADGIHFYGVRVLAESKKPETVQVRVISANNVSEVNDSLVTALRLNEPFTMTKANIFPGLEPLLDAPLNTPRLYNSSMYGQLFAEVVSKSELVPVKQVAIFEKTALASKETFNNYYSQANKFATLANGSLSNYRAAVDTMGVYSHALKNVLESTSSYGAIDNAKEITRWVFDNKPGKVSNIITVNNNFFFIAAVTGVHKEGYATVQEAASGIRSQLYSKKLAEKKTAEVAEKIAGMTDLQAIAEKLGATVSSQEDVTFSSLRAQGLDPAFIGAVCGAPVGKVCAPVAASLGTYVFAVTGRDTGSFYTEDDAVNYQTQKSQYMSQMIVPAMMEEADVKDNRARFF